MQRVVSTVEIRGSQDGIHIVVNGTYVLDAGTSINSFGLTGKISNRLLRILLLLILRRLAERNTGWVSALELSSLLEQSTPTAVQKFLQRALIPYENSFEDHPNLQTLATHLIQYSPRTAVDGRGGGHINGISRGPYRFGIPLERVSIDQDACWRYLLKQSAGDSNNTYNIFETHHSEDIFEKIHQLLYVHGDIFGARSLSSAFLRHWHLHSAQLHKKNNLYVFAKTWEYAAKVNMHLGFSAVAIRTVDKAIQIFKYLHDPMRTAEGFNIAANALGQLQQQAAAVRADRQAIAHLDNAKHSKIKTFTRAAYNSNMGQYLSILGDNKSAERKLSFGLKKALDFADTNQALILYSRLAQHYVMAHNLAHAEQQLTLAQEIERSSTENITLPAKALYVRVMADFMIATNQWSEALHWTRNSYQLGIQHRMHHHVKKLAPSISVLIARELWNTDD